jgi:hypothetical protein
LEYAGVDSDQAVYFVILEGTFTDYYARVPGNTFPTGTILTFTMDAATQGPLDDGLGNRFPGFDALSELGQLYSFAVHPAPSPSPSRS